MVPKKSFGSKEFLWFAKNPMAPKNSYGLKPRDSGCYGSKKFSWFGKIPMVSENWFGK